MIRFDDQFPLHRKVAALSEPAFRLHVEAIFWSRRNLTDGFVPTDDLQTCSRIARPDRAAAELVRRVCWHRVVDGLIVGPADNRKTGDGISEEPRDASGRDRETPARRVGCAECEARHPDLSGDGWVIHGYEDWQETRSRVAAKSEIKAKAGRAGGIKSGQSRRRKSVDASLFRSKPEADTKQRASPLLRKQRTPSALSRAESVGARTLPPDAPRCPHHNDQPPPPRCGTCRSEAIARPEETR